ncbi:MAG: hypothetical protein WA634_06340 [Silvibacterium sp.]
MRPKKQILLYCPDPELLSALAFVLRLHLYDVIAVHDSNDAIGMSEGGAAVCGVLVHVQQADPAGRVVHRILECASHLPLLLVDRVGDLAPVRYADMVLYGRNTTTSHILAALHVLCHRKRGAKPRSIA